MQNDIITKKLQEILLITLSVKNKKRIFNARKNFENFLYRYN